MCGDRDDSCAIEMVIFTDDDMDSYDVEDVDPDIRAAMRRADIEIAEPERYKDDPV